MRKLSNRSSANYLLSVNDDGVGVPNSVKPTTSSSLGMKIVSALTSQLKGKIKVLRRGGTTFQIIFPEQISSSE